jgi:photosystem II stability/assembly factor-like uncharacterized protein
MKKIYFFIIFSFLLFGFSDANASSGLGQRDWFSVASSADGSKLVTANFTIGYIYTSTDSGVNWKEQTNSGSHMWRSVASSADGSKLVAVDNAFGYIYTSTDSGVTWKQQINSGKHMWKSITSSANGMKLAAVDEIGYIATSIDGGVTWKQQDNPDKHTWTSITSSSDGTKLAVVGNGYIYTSTDSGTTWKQQNNEKIAWQSIASSADGTRLAAAPLRDYIYVSNDGGATWIKKTTSGVANWVAITSSADGTKLAAVTNKDVSTEGTSFYSGDLYTSNDSGTTWVNKTPNEGHDWRSITSSADGSKVFAGARSGYIYSYSNTENGTKKVINTSSESSSNKATTPFDNKSVVTSKKSVATAPDNLKGKILLQVESRGEAWYINPKDGKRYYMANGSEALKIMKKFGAGMSNKDIERMKKDAAFRKKFMGKILLQVESHGEAYYISFDGRYNYLKDGESALIIMKKLGLGISNINLEKIAVN